MKKILLLTAGSLSLFLGAAGVFLPVLPTTPFLLLSAFCFLRSSQKLYTWLLEHRLFGRYISSYMKYRAISAKVKVVSLIALWLTISVSAVFFVDILWVRIGLLLVAVGVSVFLLKIKTLRN